ncbi:outer-membrane lipoprotein carrier protein LolA [Cyclobacterium sp.]|uniref:LolA family protein n=1 Tax=Cyclobacterium sp. TaxID=1966343 RepID=UPI0019A65383|nr:outer-membrane lipoprotein carrier protein LolA [Cyclobacterium sp.]MBD3626769.1 outer membrane lipoprotein carrier protein LolA [Cyclobacterium sp.]
MKRNNLIVLFLIGFFGAFLTGFSQEDLATKILSSYKAKFNTLSDFSADFVYSLENPGMAAGISKKGVLHYAKGKYALMMADQEIFCDGKSIWILIPSGSPAESELNILPYDPEEGLGIEQLFFLFNEESISARYEGKQTVAGRTLDQIFLIITRQAEDINQARLWINEHTKFPEKIITIDRRQTTITYEFTKIQFDQGLPASTFVFDTSNFPGEIYDERE